MILRDFGETLFGKEVGCYFQKNGARRGYQLVQLESSQLEKKFAVYSNDQVKGRVLLKPVILDKVNHFLKRYPETIELGIRENFLFLAISSSKTTLGPTCLAQY